MTVLEPKNNQETTLLDTVVSVIKFIISFRTYFLIGTAVGTLVGLSIFFFKPKSYESRLTAYTLNLSAEEATDLVNELALAVKEKDYGLIAKMTGIPEEKALKIASLKCSPQLDVESDNFELKEKAHEVFVVTAVTKDKDFLDSLQAGIVRYIENNTFVRQRIETAKKQTKENIVEIEKEITDLRKLKGSLNQLAFSSGGRGTNLFLSDLSMTSAKIVDLIEKRTQLLRDLELTKEVNVIKDFVKFKKQSSPRLIFSLVSSIVICNVIMFLLYFWMRIKGKIYEPETVREEEFA